MIYTLTLNPAIDHIVRVEKLDVGETNRMVDETFKAGGKGINVSKLLKNLGENSLCLGFVAGFTGFELERMTEDDFNLNSDFIHVSEGLTRINTKIKAEKETEINGNGPEISKSEIEALFDQLEQIKENDYLFLSGSIPKSMDANFYGQIMDRFKNKKVNIIVDSSGASLKESLKYKPFVIKPNLRELEQIFDVSIDDNDDIKLYAKKLQEMGAKNIIVSLGADGAYMLDENGNDYFLETPQGELVDSVGSGDSMLAGFVYSVINNNTYEDAFKFSLACGSATAFSENIARKEEIYNLYEKM
ncbi:1-phosphofructokinase [Anaerococcus provencensis]|uniref:1-phosphofructokinase n=1 Tax=Anaerococcus provencensis TaxID=938293 RepID=UPI0002E003D8|nr:1-phosphofructokinase [Anaerococcus provencensis]